MPCLALPSRASPRLLTLARRKTDSLNRLYARLSPCLASPRHATPCQAGPCQAAGPNTLRECAWRWAVFNEDRHLPCLATPSQAAPGLAMPRLTRPQPATPCCKRLQAGHCCQWLPCHLPAPHSGFNGSAGICRASRLRAVTAQSELLKSGATLLLLAKRGCRKPRHTRGAY